MLNYSSLPKHCPICQTELQIEEYKDTQSAFCREGKSHYQYEHFALYQGLSLGEDSNLEFFHIGDYTLCFTKTTLSIDIEDNPGIVLADNNTIAFTDLDSLEKIEAFIQNYKILC